MIGSLLFIEHSRIGSEDIKRENRSHIIPTVFLLIALSTKYQWVRRIERVILDDILPVKEREYRVVPGIFDRELFIQRYCE